MALTPDPDDPRLVKAVDTEPRGQNEVYLVLPEEERAKGFVRPFRDAYQHVGIRPKYALRDLTPEEHERYDQYGYVHYEEYPEGSDQLGRFWTESMMKTGCGTVTTMGRVLSETYARDPQFYGATYCCGCNLHRPVEEFIWTADSARVGS